MKLPHTSHNWCFFYTLPIQLIKMWQFCVLTYQWFNCRLATGSISFATLYLGQKYFTRQIKGMKTSNIIISSTLFSLITSERANKFIPVTLDKTYLFPSGYLIVSAKLDECNKNFRKTNTGRYGETWSDKIAKVSSLTWKSPFKSNFKLAAGKLKRWEIGGPCLFSCWSAAHQLHII